MPAPSAWVLAAALAASAYGVAWATPITYFDLLSFQKIVIGGTAYDCTSTADPTCAFISISGRGDTSTITSFSVPGAYGFKNTLNSANISVSFNDGRPGYSADIDLGVGGLYVSVDQANAGAGFSSSYGPTYPLATYGPQAFQTYDLASDFSSIGFGPFCPDLNLCRQGAPLRTLDGTEFLVQLGFAPAFSFFSSTVDQVASVPEPSTVALVGLALAGAYALRSRKLR
jgi:hypothetical protein